MGRKIKDFISRAGLKQNVIAKKAGIPVQTFSAILNEKRRITAEEYFAICAALNVSVLMFKES